MEPVKAPVERKGVAKGNPLFYPLNIVKMLILLMFTMKLFNLNLV